MATNQKEAEKIEKKLRPLYDAVDCGLNKKAIQLADKLLKKQEVQCARALKAIALLRLRRQDDAVSTLNVVLASHPGDQATLQACTMYFKENSEYPKITDLYFSADQHYPNNQEIMTHLFMAYVRTGDYQKQQHTAVRLHKHFPESGPYYCWRVMSLLMQATDSKHDGSAGQLYLPLAEKLIEKYFAEKEVESEAEVRLYLMVLKKLHRREKLLEILSGPIGDKLKNDRECEEMRIECLVGLEQWDNAQDRLTKMVRSMPDQWSYIQQYISCQIKLCQTKRREGEAEGGGSDGSTSESGERGVVCGDNEEWSWTDLSGSEDYLQPINDARSFMATLAADELKLYQSDDRSRYVLRGPLLCRMELVRQLHVNGMVMVPPGLAGIEEMLTDYFTIFGTKNCVFDDLRLFVELFNKIDGDAVSNFIRQVQELVTSDPVEFDCSEEHLKINIDRLRRHTNLLKLQRFLGCLPFTNEELLSLCLKYHQQSHKLTKEPMSTVNQPRDFYAILAAHVMLEQYQVTYDFKTLWDVIFLLEAAKNSNAQISLLLMKLYGLLGGAESITDLFKEVAIKHLQLETIGYVTMRYVQAVGTFGFANQIYRNCLRFYHSSSKDFTEYIIQAYRNGAFTKIGEFIECRDRLTHSFNSVHTITEMNTLDMFLNVNSISQAREFFQRDWIPVLPCSLKDYVDTLVDNRDLNVLDDWSPPTRQLTELQLKASFELDCLWLRTRLSLVLSLREALSLTSGDEKKGGGEECPERGRTSMLVQRVEEYKTSLEQMDGHMGMLYIREVLKKGSKMTFPVQHPPPYLGYFFLQQGHGQVILNMLQITLKACEGSGQFQEAYGGSDQLQEVLKDVLQSVKATQSSLRGIPKDLRQSLSRLTGLQSPPAVMGGEEPSASVEGDHPYDILMRSQIDLELYVLLLQSLSTVLLLCMICAEVLVPSRTKKKKNKKKDPVVTRIPTLSEIQLRDFVKELEDILTSLSQSFHPLPLPENEEELTLQLKNLYISKHCNPALLSEGELKSRVCGTVLSSYDMSFRDTMQLVSSKLAVARSVVQKLGGGEGKLTSTGPVNHHNDPK